jgi:thiol-disulfide isomerase/thioredoxin
MKKFGWIITIIILVGGLVFFLTAQAKKPGKYDEVAQCITDSGAKFYGAWWCPHCQAQKAIFGKSAKKLPYVECQTRSREMIGTCTEEKIEGFPTWVFADGSRVTGERSIQELAEKTNCSLPQ